MPFFGKGRDSKNVASLATVVVDAHTLLTELKTLIEGLSVSSERIHTEIDRLSIVLNEETKRHDR